MKFLLDVQSNKVASKKSKFDQLVRGQLCTPLTNYKTWDGEFAIDNGAYSGLNRLEMRSPALTGSEASYE